jgi:membrane-bound lytic murein transglycosylase D
VEDKGVRVSIVVVVTAVVAVIQGVATPAGASRLAYDPRFDVPPAIKPLVDFWINAFVIYGRRQVVIHDTDDPERVYRVLDFRRLEDLGLSEAAIEVRMAKEVAQEKERVRSALLRIHRLGPDNPSLSPDEAVLTRLFRNDGNPRKFLLAADRNRIRSQTGLRERFSQGVATGQMYFDEMERIFEREGVPATITRLPLVESSFDLRAYSKAAASGVWQFIPSTGRRFMTINDAVDERLDPIVSTRAAARFLRENYDMLGAWPLAVMAYNHGPGGIAKAVRALGTTDASQIILRYNGPRFKFASRNFYPEFLAAVDVETNRFEHYGPLPQFNPIETDDVRVPHYVSLSTLSTCAGATPDELRRLNPSLLSSVHGGKQRVPGGYALRLPKGTRGAFERCYAGLPSNVKSTQQKRQYIVHRVRRGQTLSQIARLYGSSVDEIRRRNGLRSTNHIREGQVLQIPAG